MHRISFLLPAIVAISIIESSGQILFTEDFEKGLGGWRLRGSRAIAIIESDQKHKKVLQLKSEGLVYALIEESSLWGPTALTGEFMFPDDKDNYLGFIYNQTEKKSRIDFGSVYIKGNDSYIRVNPFRDGNASRLIYEEFKTPLQGESKIISGKWHRFKLEVKMNECHLYVDDMTLPKITFPYFEGSSGRLGFQARVAGYPVLIDNLKAVRIENLSYKGKPIPDISYDTGHLVTDWQFLGPFDRSPARLEETDTYLADELKIEGKKYRWKKIETDPRGALITGRITEYDGGKEVAYFRTTVQSENGGEVVLHISTTEELGLYVNGMFQGFVYRQGYGNKVAQDWNAWYDFTTNKDHRGSQIGVQLRKGKNYVMLKSTNGQFASGGFFMAIE